MPQDVHVEDPAHVVSEGDRVRVRVLHVDAAEGRVFLTMRGLEGVGVGWG